MSTKHDLEHQDVFFPGRLDVRATITDLLSRRWSPRAFSDRPVEPSKLLSIFEAARSAMAVLRGDQRGHAQVRVASLCPG
jgi:hypothetical protein